MKRLKGLRTKLTSLALGALGLAQTSGIIQLDAETMAGLATALLGGVGYFLRDAVEDQRKPYSRPIIKSGAAGLGAIVFALLVTTGCSASPIDAFRTLPWQGPIQGVLLGLVGCEADKAPMSTRLRALEPNDDSIDEAQRLFGQIFPEVDWAQVITPASWALAQLGSKACVAEVLDIIDGRSTTGYEERRVVVHSAAVRRQLRAVAIGNHIEVHPEVPDGDLIMRKFEDHGAPPPGWSTAITAHSNARKAAQ